MCLFYFAEQWNFWRGWKYPAEFSRGISLEKRLRALQSRWERERDFYRWNSIRGVSDWNSCIPGSSTRGRRAVIRLWSWTFGKCSLQQRVGFLINAGVDRFSLPRGRSVFDGRVSLGEKNRRLYETIFLSLSLSCRGFSFRRRKCANLYRISVSRNNLAFPLWIFIARHRLHLLA